MEQRNRRRADPDATRAKDAKHYAAGGRERAKRWADAHRETIRAKAKERYAADPEAARAYQKAWQSANREKVRAGHRASIKKHAAQHRRRARSWNKTNRDRFNLHCRAAQQKRRAQKLAAGGSFTAADIVLKLTLQNGLCFYCNRELVHYHADHYIPLSKGGTNHAANIVIACPDCNLRKHARMPDQFTP